MRVAVVGAGAIGAYVGAALARGGADVTLIARGAQLAALRERGVTVKSERGDFTARPSATGDVRAVGPVDTVILAVKAHQIEPLLDGLPALFGPETAVVAMQNGIPWWYFQQNGGPFDGRLVRSVDSDGRISGTIETRRVVGCVVYAATEIEAPGVVRHVEGTRFSLGDPDRGTSERTKRIAEALVAGGLKAPVEADLRPEIWFKVLGNATLNPVSALTRATLVEMCSDPLVEALAAEMMYEMVAVAQSHGVALPMSVEKRIDGARRVGAHKTSMLQDLEAGKAFELDAMTGAVLELGALTGVPMPATRHVYSLTKLLERSVVR